MTTDRKKPGVAFWATVVVVVLLALSLLGFAAMVWLDFRGLPEIEKLR